MYDFYRQQSQPFPPELSGFPGSPGSQGFPGGFPGGYPDGYPGGFPSGYQGVTPEPAGGGSVERRLNRFERQLDRLERRVSRIERRLGI